MIDWLETIFNVFILLLIYFIIVILPVGIIMMIVSTGWNWLVTLIYLSIAIGTIITISER